MGKLPSPVIERTLGDDDKVRAVDLLVELEVTQERDRLERLSETLGWNIVSDAVEQQRQTAHTISSARIPLIPL